jgi:hypothetical protein
VILIARAGVLNMQWKRLAGAGLAALCLGLGLWPFRTVDLVWLPLVVAGAGGAYMAMCLAFGAIQSGELVVLRAALPRTRQAAAQPVNRLPVHTPHVVASDGVHAAVGSGTAIPR